jgi:sec-independent protein translocase protein TatA
VPYIGPGELVVILMLVVLVFGATRLPRLGEGVGKAIVNFKRSLGSGDGGGSASGEKNGEG